MTQFDLRISPIGGIHASIRIAIIEADSLEQAREMVQSKLLPTPSASTDKTSASLTTPAREPEKAGLTFEQRHFSCSMLSKGHVYKHDPACTNQHESYDPAHPNAPPTADSGPCYSENVLGIAPDGTPTPEMHRPELTQRTAEAEPEMPERVLGKCAGLQFVPRGDGGILFQLMIEDDGNWHPKNFTMSTHWLDDLERVIQQAKTRIGQRPSEARPDFVKAAEAFIEEFLPGEEVAVAPLAEELHDAYNAGHRAGARTDKAPTQSVWAVSFEHDGEDSLAGLFSSLEKAETYAERVSKGRGELWTIREWVVDGVAVSSKASPRLDNPLPSPSAMARAMVEYSKDAAWFGQIYSAQLEDLAKVFVNMAAAETRSETAPTERGATDK